MNQDSITHKLHFYIDWVNSLPIKSCIIVNCLFDFASGDIFIDIIAYFLKLISKYDVFLILLERISNIHNENKIDYLIQILSNFISLNDLEISTEEKFTISILDKLMNIVTNYKDFSSSSFSVNDLNKIFDET